MLKIGHFGIGGTGNIQWPLYVSKQYHTSLIILIIQIIVVFNFIFNSLAQSLPYY